jgi:hypothetical protein
MECIACSTSFLDPLNPPIVQTCRCVSRVCFECRPYLQRCPLCREHTLTEDIDREYVLEVKRMKRSITCEGCAKVVSTRLAVSHLEACPLYLRRRVLETRLDKLRIDHAYNEMAGVNQQLRMQNFAMNQQIMEFSRVHAPMNLLSR